MRAAYRAFLAVMKYILYKTDGPVYSLEPQSSMERAKLKLMFEIDSANVEETRLVAKFLTEAATLAERQALDKAPSINGDSHADIPLHPEAPAPTLAEVVADGRTFPPASGLVAPSNVVQLHAPTPPAPPAPPGAPLAPEFDANGMPWDARIHASNKAKTITGAWKYKRGVDDATKASVEASLPRGPATVSAETTANALPPLPPTPPAPTLFNEPGTPFAPPLPPHTIKVAGVPTTLENVAAPLAPVPLPPNLPPPPVPDEDATESIDFPTLMIRVSEAMGAGQLTHDQITAKIKPIGIDNLFTLSSRPDLVAGAAAALGF
jgi:hypothetical protein